MPNEQDMQTHGTGALQSPEDYRYISLGHLLGASGTQSSPDNYHIDYSAVDDLYQRKIGACTAHSTSEIVIHRSIRKGHKIVASPRFSYTLSKMHDGVPDANQGTYPVMPFKMLVKFGVASETTIPNDTKLTYHEYIYNRNVRAMPQEAFDEAHKNHIVPGYAQVGRTNDVTEEDIKQALMTDGGSDGVSILIPDGNEWWTAKDGRISWATKDIIPIRKMIKYISGHEITITGWETEKGTGRCKLFFRNHWSTAWANQDNGWFYFDQHKITEAWMISEIPKTILKVVKSLPNRKSFKHTWYTQLMLGSRGCDVEALQTALIILGFMHLAHVTDYFGELTQIAVMKFQRANKVASEIDIRAARGQVGHKTRAAINKIFSK